MKVATRRLRLHSQSVDADVQIDIFAPERDGEAWTCRYEINWPAEKWSSHAGGLDSMQAVILALQKIGTDIYFSDYHKSGSLFWESPEKGYGFPLPPSAREMLVGDDARFF
jgi:hypothetical protein